MAWPEESLFFGGVKNVFFSLCISVLYNNLFWESLFVTPNFVNYVPKTCLVTFIFGKSMFLSRSTEKYLQFLFGLKKFAGKHGPREVLTPQVSPMGKKMAFAKRWPYKIYL